MLRDGVVQGNDAGMVFSIGRFRIPKRALSTGAGRPRRSGACKACG
jgi:hypothetical protein